MTDTQPRQPADAFSVGSKVIAGGSPGVIQSIAFSVATQAFLYVVAHDPRIRLTYRFHELTPAP